MAVKEINPAVVEKLSKIQALIDQGVEGEKSAANMALQRILEKHNITMDDYNDTVNILTVFPYRRWFEKDLVFYVLRFITGSWKNHHVFRDSNKKQVKVKLSKLDSIACSAAYDYFRNHFHKQYLEEIHRPYQANKFAYGRTPKARQAAKKLIQETFFAKYCLNSGLTTDDDYITNDSSTTVTSEAYEALMKKPDAGKYHTQLSTMLELGE